MRTMMMTLAILFFSACGVDDPQANTAKPRLAPTMPSAPAASTDPGTAQDELAPDEPQFCELSTDCEIGSCDRQTHTCVGDVSIHHKPSPGE